MSLHITPENVELTYDLLRSTMPFCKWRLPHSDDISFRIMATRDYIGCFHGVINGPHEISISGTRIGSLDTLVRVMAHEMIHLKQETAGTTTPNTEHNAEFYKLAKMVAKYHCFDPKEL